MENEFKQIIIIRKDLEMSPGKVAAQVSHASEAFLIRAVIDKAMEWLSEEFVLCPIAIPRDCFESWICGSHAKTCLRAKNKNQLLKAVTIAEEIGLKKDKDFFLVYDECRTEIEPEEEEGTTLTCIGFAPLPCEIADKIGRKYQLY